MHGSSKTPQLSGKCDRKCEWTAKYEITLNWFMSYSVAYTSCEANYDNGDCKAFSLQDDYRPGNDGLKMYFLYKASAEPSPAACGNDLNAASCSYFTANGLAPGAKATYNVKGLVN